MSYRIAVDVMGADKGILEVVVGAVDALRSDSQIEVVLVGPRAETEKALAETGYSGDAVSLVNANDSISMNEHPAQAVRKKPDASIVKCCSLVHDGTADAVVSLGNTGASVAASLLRIRRIKGVDRPAIAVPIPTPSGVTLLLDAGANADCRPRQLMQFAVMGGIYHRVIAGDGTKRIGLLSIGEEPEKGNELTLETFKLLSQSVEEFVGNVEGKDIPSGEVDVVVCDGFVGNVVLKFAEGMATALFSMMRTELTSRTRTKIGALLSKPAFISLKRRMDYAEYGGAPLLGVSGMVIIGHGRSDARAVRNAIGAAARGLSCRIVEAIAQKIAAIEEQPTDQP